MALIIKQYTFSSGATIIASEHNSNLDIIYNDYNGNITNVNLSGSANISDTKLAQITTANKVATSAITDGDIDLAKVTCDSTHYEEGSAPSTAVSEGALYTKDTSGQPELFYREESDGDEVQITTGGRVNGGLMVQRVKTQTGASATGNTALPSNDTIPQNTEGDEYMTLAITPTSATNELRIDVVFIGSPSTATRMVACIFQDSTADALAVATSSPGASEPGTISFSFIMVAGTTSATTFKVRAGLPSGTLTFNGDAGSRQYGGKMVSSIVIAETSV